jgi:hypothetical protein
MVRFKFIARPKIPVVSFGLELMASDETPKASAQQLEA